MRACMLSHFNSVQVFATPWTVDLQASLSMGLSRQEYWSQLPFPSPRDLPKPGVKPTSPALADGFFTTDLPGTLPTDIPQIATFLPSWDGCHSRGCWLSSSLHPIQEDFAVCLLCPLAGAWAGTEWSLPRVPASSHPTQVWALKLGPRFTFPGTHKDAARGESHMGSFSPQTLTGSSQGWGRPCRRLFQLKSWVTFQLQLNLWLTMSELMFQALRLHLTPSLLTAFLTKRHPRGQRNLFQSLIYRCGLTPIVLFPLVFRLEQGI